MKLSSACLRITITSSAVLSVLGHATLIDPEGMERMLTPCRDECAENLSNGYDKYYNVTSNAQLAFLGYNAHWFTTGTAPGCKATVSTALCYDYVNRAIILANIIHELFRHYKLITWPCSTFSFYLPFSLCRVKIQMDSGGGSAKNCWNLL